MRRAQRGAVLLEALVAIAIFGVGVLGHLELQARAVRHLDAANARGEAARLADALLARMWATDPARLALRFGVGPGQAGEDDFIARARDLPGGGDPDNSPEVGVAPGPTPASRRVTIVLRWRAPGESVAHRHRVSAVVSRN
jgi:type IV pilus assembly protein PilV